MANVENPKNEVARIVRNHCLNGNCHNAIFMKGKCRVLSDEEVIDGMGKKGICASGILIRNIKGVTQADQVIMKKTEKGAYADVVVQTLMKVYRSEL